MTIEQLKKAQEDESFQLFLALLFGRTTKVEHNGRICEGIIWRNHVYFRAPPDFDEEVL